MSKLRPVLHTVLEWRPHSLLDYLLLVAVVGILIAVAVIVAVELHLLSRLF